MYSCLADLFDAVANRNFGAHQAYPDRRYQCSYTLPFSHGPTLFTLQLTKIDAPNWDFTFTDIAEDLAGIFFAAQRFIDPVYGIPQLQIGVFRYRNGQGGPTFWSSEGSLKYWVPSNANVSVV